MLTLDVLNETARMLAEIDGAVQRGDLTADRGARDRLRGATLAVASLSKGMAGGPAQDAPGRAGA